MPFLGAVGAFIGKALVGVSSFLASGSLLANVAMAGLSIAGQYAAQKLFGQKAKAQASQLDTRYGENLNRSIVLGRVGTAGHQIYRNAYGKGNRTVQDVYVLSHWHIAGIPRVRYKGEWKALGGPVDAERGQRVQGIDAEIWIKVYIGSMTQPADAGLIARSNPPGRWTAAHRGAGVAYAIVTSVLTRDQLPSPWEAFFEVEGVCYDWRQDSTVGGDGPQRWAEPAAWGATANPVLMMYALERGFWRGDQLILGKGISASALPMGEWTIAANISDEIATGTQRYQAACIVSSGEGVTHDANMQPLLEACAGTWVALVGQEYPIVGANQASVVTFTDDDIVIDEPYRFSAKRARTELVNTVAGSFIDPGAFYQSIPIATRVDEAAFAADRERLAASIPYSAVTNPIVADRLADIALRASRYQANAEICLRPKFLGLKPGQWVTWQSARYNTTRKFQVLTKRLGAFGTNSARNVYVSLQEVGDGVFDPTAYVTIPPDGIVQGAPDFLSEVENMIVAALTVKDPVSGKQYPGIRVSWDTIDDPTVTFVEVRYRPTAQPDVLLYHPPVPVDQTVVTLVNGLVSSTFFEVSTRLVTRPFRASPWSDWQEILTPAAPWNDIVVPDELLEQIEENYQSAVAFTGEKAREAREAARRLAMYGLEQDGANLLDKQELRTTITARAQDIEATYDLKIAAVVSDLGGTVSRVETLEVVTVPAIAAVANSATARVETVEGVLTVQGQQIATIDLALIGKASVSAFNGLVATVTQQGDTITAVGEAQIAIDAKVGNFYAGGLIRMEQIATESGALSTVAISAAASEGSAASQAAIILNAKAGGISEIGLIADRTYIRQGSSIQQLIVFDGSTFRVGGGIRASWAQIDNVQVLNAQIANAAITSPKSGPLLVCAI